VRRDYAQVDARYVPGDVNENLPAVLAALPTPEPRRQVLGFCFVDPFGLRNLRFRTIEQLANRRMDFMVLVPSGYDATRNQGIYLSASNPTVDLFLGDRGWRGRWEVARTRRETFDVFLTNELGHSMKRLGYLYDGIANSQLIRSTEKKLRLYRLVLFSRHELAKKFWREVRRYASPQRDLPY
jgi:three-Cys-motif partner protein